MRSRLRPVESSVLYTPQACRRARSNAQGMHNCTVHQDPRQEHKIRCRDGDLASDTWDNGKLWRVHLMIRKQAAFDITTTTDHGIYVTEQDIDDWLIQKLDDDRSTASTAQSAENLQEGVEEQPSATCMERHTCQHQQLLRYEEPTTRNVIGTSSTAHT